MKVFSASYSLASGPPSQCLFGTPITPRPGWPRHFPFQPRDAALLCALCPATFSIILPSATYGGCPEVLPSALSSDPTPPPSPAAAFEGLALECSPDLLCQASCWIHCILSETLPFHLLLQPIPPGFLSPLSVSPVLCLLGLKPWISLWLLPPTGHQSVTKPHQFCPCSPPHVFSFLFGC